jgi:hypothetical protein
MIDGMPAPGPSIFTKRTLLIQVISHDMNIKGFIQFCAEGRSGHPWEMLWQWSRLGSCWDATRHIFSDGNLYIYIYLHMYIYIFNLMIIVWWTMFFLWWLTIFLTFDELWLIVLTWNGIQGCHGDLSIILIGIVPATFWCSRNRDLLTSIGCFSKSANRRHCFVSKMGLNQQSGPDSLWPPPMSRLYVLTSYLHIDLYRYRITI